MRRTIIHALMSASLLITSFVSAQSTISDRELELTSGGGMWTALLPAYELGTNTNGSPAFRDNLDDVGFFGQLKAVRRFLGTRTSFETKTYYAFAESISTTDVIDVDVPNPATGANNLWTGGRTHLRSRIQHYGIDVALRDTWRTRFGGLSAGAAFSYMAFDQNFDVDYGADQLLVEDLDTDFLGGKAIFGWDGCVRSQPSNLDLAIGIYDMDVDYRLLGQSISGFATNELTEYVVTVEPSFTTHTMFRGFRVSWTVGVMYISDMPTIVHAPGSDATLDTDDALTLNTMFEILL
jgi:hypothetical protein